MTASVYDDYSATLVMPDKSSTTKMDRATIEVTANGTTKMRTLNTGLNYSINLSEYLGNIYGFKGATFNVTLKGDGKTENGVYQLSAMSSNTINGTLVSGDANAVQNILRNQVVKTTNPGGNTYVYAADGSYFQYGAEKLNLSGFRMDISSELKSEDLAQEIVSTIDAYFTENKEKLYFADENVKDSWVIKLFLTAGTEAAYSNTKVTLANDVLVTVDLSNNAKSSTRFLEGRLQDAYDVLGAVAALGNERKDGVLAAAFKLLDEVALDINGLDIDVTVEFAEDWKYEREGLTVGGYYTLTLDRELKTFEGAELYEINQYVTEPEYSETGLILLQAVETLPQAGKPYIVKAMANKFVATASNSAEVVTAAGASVNGLYGVLADDATVLYNNNEYVYQLESGVDYYLKGGDKYYKAGEKNYLRPYYAYFKLSEVTNYPAETNYAASRKMVMIGGSANVATEMMVVEETTETVSKVVENGTLYVVKDGVKYNAQGQVVE